jgi:hypothetical protein
VNALVTAIEPKGSWFHGQPDRDLLDAFLVQQSAPWPGTKFHGIGDAWQEFSWSDARALIVALTSKSMAYDAVFDPEWTGPVAPHDFLGQFAANARLYTNAQSHGGWMPATTATFDRGIGAVDDSTIGIFWAQDED